MTKQTPEQIALERIEQATYELDLSGLGLAILPPEIGKLKKLISLNLQNNHISELPPEFRQLINLQELNLSVCHFEYLPIELTVLPSLKYLFLFNNELSSLPTEIGRLKSLKVLKAHNMLALDEGGLIQQNYSVYIYHTTRFHPSPVKFYS